MKSSPKQEIPRQRHVPQRSCVACREKKAKRDLIRLLCSAGIVEIDPNGKKTGRGTYLCPSRECWEAGLKGNRLEHALRTKLTPENRHTLLECGKSLLEKGDNQG